MRIIFFAGKGGVGKTSVAAATGLRAAALGHRTIILSLDVAHSLADIFDLKGRLLDQHKGTPVRVTTRLWIQELDIQEEMHRNWGDIHKYLASLLNTSGLDEILAEELAILPGMEEISLLLYINRYVQQHAYDLIVLDCAPTGEALRFISLPTTLEWYMKKIFRLERTVVKYVRPVSKRLYDVPLPDDTYFQAVEKLFVRLQGVDRVLSDPGVTTVRLVTNPEKVVLKETQRAFMYFALYRMNIDAVIMNRILPKDLKGSYLGGWLKGQERHLREAEVYFSPVPMLPVMLSEAEILGSKRLRALAAQLYGQRDPLAFFFNEPPYTLEKHNGRYRLQLKLPFITKQDIDMAKVADELIIRIGSFKRHIMLPRPVAPLAVAGAKLHGAVLTVRFQGEEHA